MKLKVTFIPNCDQFTEGPLTSQDILITANPTKLIGEIAQHLCHQSPPASNEPCYEKHTECQRIISSATLCIIDGSNKIILRPHQYLRDSILADGMTIGIMPHIFDYKYSYSEKVLGSFTDTNSQKTYPLYFHNYFGRAFGNDIQLSEREISRNHCIIHILPNETHPIQIKDLGAKNIARLVSEGEDISSITQESTQMRHYAVNDTQIMQIDNRKYLIDCFPLENAEKISAKQQEMNAKILAKHQQKWVNRGYLIPAPPDTLKLKTPKQNKPTKPQPLNIVSVIIPLILGGILYFIMPNPMTVMFLMLSPLMIVGNSAFNKLKFKREKRESEQKHELKLEKIHQKTKEANETFLETARLRHPSFESIRLWQKQKLDPDYYDIRIGTSEVMTNIFLDERPTKINNAPLLVSIRDCLAYQENTTENRSNINTLLVNIISMYSYTEVEIGIIACGNLELHKFEWLKWTNHLNLDLICNSPKTQHSLLEKLQSYDNKGKTTIVIIANVLAENYGVLERLIEEGRGRNIYYIWHNDILNSTSESAKTLIYFENLPYYINRGPKILEKQYFEPLPMLSMDSFEARAKWVLCHKDLSEVAAEDERIPKVFLFENLFDYDATASPEQILSSWHRNERNIAKDSPLKCAIGMTNKNQFTVDLRANGPHALIGGTTGAGKSEFLQSWITSLALTSSPYRVNFLLVDYKGGSAFDKCSQFPHTVGLITDLDPHLTRRITVSLHAELVRRELILKEHNAKDLVTLEKLSNKCILSNLVIVIDEFAALAKEMPEFVDELVDIAARGRSLGIHLIMATQRPSGVIKDNIKANTNLRIALRVTNQSESNEIIGIKDAANIPEDIPGRFFAAFGGNNLVEAQSAYIGYNADKKEEDILIQDFSLNSLVSTNTINDNNHTSTSWGSTPETTFLAKVTKSIQYSYMELAYNMTDSNKSKIHIPWQEPLKDNILFNITNSSVATLDNIHNCTQPEVSALELLGDDNTLITGKNGSGKTNSLEVIIASMLCNENLSNNYFINCASSPLTITDCNNLQVIDIGQTEQLYRLLDSIFCTRGGANHTKTLLFIDRIDLLKEAFESPELQSISNIWNKLLSNCSSYNLQIIATSGRIGGIYQNWLSYFSKQIYLELSIESEYNIASIKPSEIIHKWPSGRALIMLDNTRYEMQFHHLESMQNMLEISSRKSQYTQPKIDILHENYFYSNNILGFDSFSLSSIDKETLLEVTTPIFIIGKNGSGKTTVANLLSHILNIDIIEMPNHLDESQISALLDEISNRIITVPHNLLQGNWNLLNLIRKSECVILLNINHNEASSILPQDLPSVNFVPQSPGRGYMIVRNVSYYLQFCHL